MEQELDVVASLPDLRPKKERQTAIFGTPGSACKRQFSGVTVGGLDVKSLVEHNGEG